MRLCVKAVLVLLLALTRARADPVPAAGSEECSKLDKLRTITDRNEVVGRFYFMGAFTENELFKNLLGLTSNLWGDMTLTENGLHVQEFSKMNGTCHQFRANITVHGEMAKTSMGGVTSEFKLHNLTRTLFIMDLTASTSDALAFIQNLHLDPSLTQGQNSVTAHCYYLISREPEASENDLQLFREHAKCAGFTGEPSFLYKSDQGYCTEKESVLIDPEECSKLEKLDTITDKTQVVGPFYFMMAFTDNYILKNIIRLSSSIWVEITLSETGFHVQEFSKMNGTCLDLRFNVTIDGDTYKSTIGGVLSEFKFRNFTRTSRIMDVTLSSPDILPLLQNLHIDPSVTHGQSSLKGHGYYLISTEPEVNEGELQLFRKYAKCAGFTDEPALINKGNQDYCAKEGSIRAH